MAVDMIMATQIGVDVSPAKRALNNLKSSINIVDRSSQTLYNSLKSAGDMTGAWSSRVNGLNTVLDREKEVISQLRDRQASLLEIAKNKDEEEQTARDNIARVTQAMNEEANANGRTSDKYKELREQLKQYNTELRTITNVGTKLETTNRQLGIQEAKLQRDTQRWTDAKRQLDYYASGLGDLKKQYNQINQATDVHVQRLQAEGRQAEATTTRYDGLKNQLDNLRQQYRLEETALNQIADVSSEAYNKQKISLDKTGAAIAKTKEQMLGMSSTVSRLQPTGVDRVDRALVRVKDNASIVKGRLSSAFQNVKSTAMTATPAIAGIGAALGKGAIEATNLQNSYQQTKNLLITGGEQSAEAIRNVAQMQKDGQQYSVQYGISQKEIADAYQELTKRGYTSSQSLGAMKTMMQASVASGEPLTDVVNNSTAALEAFGLKADGTAQMMRNTKQAVNEMAYAADMTATDFNSMGVAMEYAGPQARTLGYSVGETASAIGILSNNGLEADKAGTGLRQVLNSLIAPTAGAKKQLKAIGLSTKDFTDKAGKMKPINEIMAELNQHTSNLNSQQKGALFKALFGSTGESAALILAKNSEQLGDLNKKVQNSYKGQGYVAKLAERNTGSAKVSFNQFKEAANAVAMTLGKQLLPSLRDGAVAMAKFFNSKQGQQDLQALANGVRNFAQQTEHVIQFMIQHQQAVKTFGKIFIGAFALTKAITTLASLKRSLGILVPGMNKVNLTGKALQLVFRGLGVAIRFMFANPLGIAITAITALSVGLYELYKHNAKFRNFVNGIGHAISQGFGAAINWIKKNWGNLALMIVNPVAGGLKMLYDNVPGFRKWANGVGGHVKHAFNSVKTHAHSVVTTVGNFFTKDIPNAITGAWGALKNAAEKAVHALLSPLNGGLKKLEKVWNKMAGKLHVGEIHASLPGFANGTGPIDRDQLAIVNDSKTDHWRELMFYQNRLFAFPNQRDFMTLLPKGAEIINGDDAHKLMPGYANGTSSGMQALMSWANGINDYGSTIHTIELRELSAKLTKQMNDRIQKIWEKEMDAIEARDESGTDEDWYKYNRQVQGYEALIDKAYAWKKSNMDAALRGVPMFAKGGLATAPGIVGEAGYPEMVVPLADGQEGNAFDELAGIIDHYRTGKPSSRNASTEQLVNEVRGLKEALLGALTKINEAQGTQISATRGIQGYDKDVAIRDNTEAMHNAATFGMTY